MKNFSKIILFAVIISGLTAAKVAFASNLIPECLLGTTFSAECDNINQFIILGINVGTYIFGFIGALALLFFVYGGFILILSQGNQEKIKQGTGAMTAAVIGLVIAFGAYALITFLGNTVGLKAEKSLNFVETAWAGDTTPQRCTLAEGCYCLDEDSNECSAIINDDDCYGTLTTEPCEDSSVGTGSNAAGVMTEEVGTATGDTSGNISALKQAAMSLNPADIGEPADLFARAINAMTAFMGSIALILYIYAGFIWMSAGGAADKITKAKNILIWTTLGAVAMGAGYMIIRTVLEKIG
ncbi:MAG: pilin [Patescibacteria group bacterium]